MIIKSINDHGVYVVGVNSKEIVTQTWTQSIGLKIIFHNNFHFHHGQTINSPTNLTELET